MSRVLDVVIIGAGSAGLSALREVRTQTQSFAIINDGPWGTMCARVGCMPSKLLIAAANACHSREDLRELGIRGGEHLVADLPAVLRRVRALRDAFVKSNLPATRGLGHRAISGRAQLLGPGVVRVNGKELRTRRLIIATGSSPIVPAPWKALGERLLTTDTLFEQQTFPSRMAVIGLGALGVELAQALARLGITVTAFEGASTIAGLTDPQVSSAAVHALRRELTLHLGHAAQLAPTATGVRVSAAKATTVVGKVLVALGRRPNVEGLGLDTLGVALNEEGLPKVNPRTMQLGRLPVFLTGDATGEPSVLHVALDDGHIAAVNALAKQIRPVARRTPLSIVFCEPGIARVGRPFSELDPLVGEARFEDQGRARIAQRNFGILRVYADRASHRLLGAELCAPAAEHLAHLLALAIQRKLTVRQLLQLPFYHPTFEEGLRSALRSVGAKAAGRNYSAARGRRGATRARREEGRYRGV